MVSCLFVRWNFIIFLFDTCELFPKSIFSDMIYFRCLLCLSISSELVRFILSMYSHSLIPIHSKCLLIVLTVSVFLKGQAVMSILSRNYLHKLLKKKLTWIIWSMIRLKKIFSSIFLWQSRDSQEILMFMNMETQLKIW